MRTVTAPVRQDPAAIETAWLSRYARAKKLEHGDLAAAMRALVKPGGVLVATTPVPRFDWVCKGLEGARVLQKRTGEHVNLVDLRGYPGFEVVDWKVKGFISRWGILRPRP